MQSVDTPSQDLGLHLLARRSLVAALREAARNPAPGSTRPGQDLEIEGEVAPSREGVNFGCRLEGQSLSIEARGPDGFALQSYTEYRAPNRRSLLPPLLAVVLAILWRKPLLSLVAAVLLGGGLELVRQGASTPQVALGALSQTLQEGLLPQLTDWQRGQTILFVVCMLALVGVMTCSGGVRGMVDWLSRIAKGARSSQVATWLMGLAVFFDDYANCVLVGTTMRPLTDRYRISREKLSYLVDSTAAPVAGISIFSTWVAFEVSTYSAQLPSAGRAASEGFAVFLATIPLRFYCWFALLMAGLVAITGRDFGPMLTAERRARTTGQLVRAGGTPMAADASHLSELPPGVQAKAWRALLPLATFLGLSLLGIFYIGGAFQISAKELFSINGLTSVLYKGSGPTAMLFGSAVALALAVAIALAAGLGGAVLRAAWTTLRSMSVAIGILYLAWMIGATCEHLGTAPYLTALMGDRVAPELLPILLLLVSSAIAFATGTSWGTMSILLPLVPGLAYHLGEDSGFGGSRLLLLCIGAVLEGSIFGDHCSPISDTTVLSSTACAADHIDHVRTQIPYALTGLAVAAGLGYFPVAFLDWSPWLALGAGTACLVAIVFLFGKPSAAPGTVEPRA